MAGTNTESNENQEVTVEIDPWEAAFAAVNAETSGNSQAAPGTNEDQGASGASADDTVSAGVNGSADASSSEAGNGMVSEDNIRGLGSDNGSEFTADGGFGNSDESVTEKDVEEYRESIRQEVTQQAIDVVAQKYIEQGIRHTNGKLGADINQPDICKRDRDGVPRFYNPETGREFTGDNPRRQAQEWCDDYNRELAKEFNNSCDQYVSKLMKDYEPEIAVLAFDATYNSLDPIRRSMLDSLIEDYEIVKDGEVVGYSCDLNKALQAVNRQVRIIQENYKSSLAAHQSTPEEPKGPALDLKASAAAGKDKSKKPEFKSIAEAMEWEQDQLLEKMKNKKH